MTIASSGPRHFELFQGVMTIEWAKGATYPFAITDGSTGVEMFLDLQDAHDLIQCLYSAIAEASTR